MSDKVEGKYNRGRIVEMIGTDPETGRPVYRIWPSLLRHKPRGRRRSSRDGIYVTPGGVR